MDFLSAGRLPDIKSKEKQKKKPLTSHFIKSALVFLACIPFLKECNKAAAAAAAAAKSAIFAVVMLRLHFSRASPPAD